DVDDPGAHVLAFDPRLQRHQHVLALFQEVAELVEALLKQDRLVLPRWIGQLDDTDLGASARAPLAAVENAGAKARTRGAVAHRANELRPTHGSQPLERRVIGFKRMAGEEEPDGVVLAPEPLGLRPRRGARSQRGRLGLAEQRIWAGGSLEDAAVGDRKDRLDRGERDRPLWLQAIEGPRRGKALERLLVDMARIEPRREVAKRSKGAFPPSADERLGLRLADALDRAPPVT